MTLARTVADVLRDHVTLEVECIDRMYLNVYVPRLQFEQGVACFFRYHRGHQFASSALMKPMSDAFVADMKAFAKTAGVPIVEFTKRQRKDDVMKERLKEFDRDEGVVFVGKAQEKTPVLRTECRKNPVTGQTYAWLVRSTAMVNHFYFYCVDRDFGPFFLKFGTYFPYTAKLCINGHEYVKRQLGKRGIEYEALDNGILSCGKPGALHCLCDGLSAEKIDSLLRKWLAKLPHPFTAQDRAAGYRYQLSILQAEFSLTQVLDRPVSGRVFFEDVIRENLDIGRPEQVQLIFDRRVTRKTPGRFRTRVITQGVVPSLHVDYKRSTRIKQYHKEGRALRTETTINNTYDFGIARGIKNLPVLREIGFQANRRLLDVQRVSHDCAMGEDVFERIQKPLDVDDQRAPAMRFGDERVQTLLSALLIFCLLPNGFTSKNLRERIAPLLGKDPSDITAGRMTYDLRRCRLHGLIERIPRSRRYRLTSLGLRVALFYTRAYGRILRPGLALVAPDAFPADFGVQESFDRLEVAMNRWCDAARLTA